MCRPAGKLTAAVMVDHRVPHRGDLALFWDPENWQSLCNHHHNRIKQAEEKSGKRAGIDNKGRPTHRTTSSKPSQRERGKPLSNMAMLELLRGLRPDQGFTVHGFRSTFRDWAASKKYQREACEAALAHLVAKSRAEAAYLRMDFLDERKLIMEAWARQCLGLGEARRGKGHF